MSGFVRELNIKPVALLTILESRAYLYIVANYYFVAIFL